MKLLPSWGFRCWNKLWLRRQSTKFNGVSYITQRGAEAIYTPEGKEQVKALEDGELDGLVVQNPFGMGYAAVIASARTVLEIGNEAEVNTGYVWVTAENMDDADIKPLVYK